MCLSEEQSSTEDRQQLAVIEAMVKQYMMVCLSLWFISGVGKADPEAPEVQPGLAGEHVLQPGHIIRLTVGYTEGSFPQLDGFHFVDEKHGVSLPHLGRFLTKGKTLNQLRADVREAFVKKSKLNKDVIYLGLFKPPSLKGVLVFGQVKKSGELAIKQEMTLGLALEKAGGATPFGSARRVQLLRNGKRYVYDLKNNKKHLGVVMQSKDILYIPQKRWVGR